MRLIKWDNDPLTEYWASKLSPGMPSDPYAQYAGHRCMENTWRRYTLEDFPAYCDYSQLGYLYCSPFNIIKCFRDSKMLEGLALTIAWGAMARTRPHSHANSLSELQALLLECQQQITKSERIEDAWKLLRERLSWSDVMISKSLHFIARSLEFEANPPVPLDNEVILDRIWPIFRNAIVGCRTSADPPIPAGWRDSYYSWGGFNRYMTVINCWARSRGWTTTQVENTLYRVVEMDLL